MVSAEVSGRHQQLVRLVLLGGFRLRVDDQAVVVPRAAQRLVALLALRGATSRSRVAGTLWPESPQHQALTNLRHVVWKLQNGLPHLDLVVPLGQDLGLAPGLQVDTDALVHHSRRLLLEGRLPDTEGSADLLRADTELLPEWGDAWLDDERERFRQLRLHVLEAWADSLLEWGRFGMALDVALVVLRADVLRESAHRTVIKVHRAEGNVGEARRAFEACRRILRSEVGVAPSPETAALVP